MYTYTYLYIYIYIYIYGNSPSCITIPLHYYTNIPIYHYIGANGAEGGLTVLREVPDHQMGGGYA